MASAPDLHFAVVDLKRALESMPATSQEEKPIREARDKGERESASDAELATKMKEIQETSAKSRSRIVEDLETVVITMAGSTGTEVLFDASGTTLNGIPLVLVHRGLPDLTDNVIAAIKAAAP